METKRLPLNQILATRDSSANKDSILKNCYHEETPLGPMIVKRPGFSLSDSLGVGCAQGGISYDGQAIWVVSDTLHVTGGAGIPALSAFTALTAATKPSNGSSVGTAMAGYLVSHGGDLYSIGGRDNGDTTVSVYKSINDGVSWSTISTPWTTTTFGDAGSSLAVLQKAVSFNGKIYALGIVGTRNIQSSADGITWTQETSDLSSGGTRTGTALIVHNNLLYAFLGSSSATVQIWSSSNGSTWTAVNSGITAIGNRAGFSVWSLNDKLYLAAGFDGSIAKSDVWTSVDNGANWVLLSAVPGFSARWAAGAWVLNGRIWIGGGTTNGTSMLNDVWGSSDGSAWLLGVASAGWSARRSPSCCVHEDKMYVGSGVVAGGASITAGLFSATATTSTNFTLTPPPATSCLPFQMTLIPATLTTPTAVFLKNNQVAYYYNGLSVVQITDPDYPPSTVFGVVYLDGTVYVMNSRGVIYGSDLNAPTSWTATNFISANAEADAAVALVRQLNYVVAFKEFSTEFFYDAGNATGSPLSKVLNALLEIGCAAAGSIAFSDNTVYFMANSRQKGRSIMKMEGYTPKYISNQYIDRILNADDLSEVYAFVVKTNGHFFYVLTLVDSGITLVLDEVTGEWHTWSHLTAESPLSVVSAVVQSDGSILCTTAAPHGAGDGDPVTIAGGTPAAVNGQFNLRYNTSAHSTSQFSYTPATTVSGAITGSITAVFYTESFFPGVYYTKGGGEDLLLDIDSGDVYNFSPSVYEDNDLPIDVKIRTMLNDFGVMFTKRYSRFELVGDKETTNVLVRYSDDDYDSWSLYRTIPMAQKRAKISGLGSARRRAFELRNTEATALRLLAAELDFEVGAF